MRVSEIHVKQIRVNQGLGVLLFFRNDGLWYFGKSHLTRNTRQIYLKNMVNPEKKSICANELESNFWFKTKDNSSFPILVSCENQEQILT